MKFNINISSTNSRNYNLKNVKTKKLFFNRIYKKLKKNNLLEHNLHLIVGTNILENSFFKNQDLLKCLLNYKKKKFFLINFFSDILRSFSLILKILFFKFLTPNNQTKKFKKKKILVTSYMPQTNFFERKNFFLSYQWGTNLDKLKSRFDIEYLQIFPLNYFTLKKLFKNIFKNSDLKSSNQLFFLNFISVKEIIFIFLNLIFKKIKIKSNDSIDMYINNSLKSYCLIESEILNRIFENFFKLNKDYFKCFYLFENQNWEKFLLYHWKHSIKKEIIPFNHSVCRFNDLRIFTAIYFSKFKIFKNYFPDKIIINDKISLKNISSFDKKFNIIKTNNEDKEFKINYKKNKIALLLGDINLDTSKKLLNVALKLKNKNFLNKVIYKPHPSNSNKSFNSKCEIYLKELKYFNNHINYVFCANTTTTILKIYQNFPEIFVYIPQNQINLSPLFNIDNKIFYSDCQKLLKIIKNNSKKTNKRKSIYFKNLKSKIFTVRQS